MIQGYQTIDEAAAKWGISARRVRVLCSQNRIEGVVKFGHAWAIPSDSKKPTDQRVTTGDYKNWREKYGKKSDVNAK